MKKNFPLGIVVTGLLLTISIVQEPVSASPLNNRSLRRSVKEGGEWLWDSGQEKADDWFGNSPQNRERLEKAREWYFQDKKAHKKACRRGSIQGLYAQGEDEQEDNINLGTFMRSTRVTQYGCREVTEQFYDLLYK